MTKVITYGTYDLLHYGHIRLLERAKKLGDYLIVGVTADDFDKTRGKINVQQSLMERIEAVRATGLADKIMMLRKMQLSFRLKKMNKVPSRLKSVQLDITSTWPYNTSKWT